MSKWSMKKDRELIRLCRTKLGIDQIASGAIWFDDLTVAREK